MVSERRQNFINPFIEPAGISLSDKLETRVIFGAKAIRGNTTDFILLDADLTKKVILPESVANEKLEDIEGTSDRILFFYLSKYENPKVFWPHTHSVVSHIETGVRIYEIVEFPVIVERKRLISIKQSVWDGKTEEERNTYKMKKLLALRYSLSLPL